MVSVPVHPTAAPTHCQTPDELKAAPRCLQCVSPSAQGDMEHPSHSAGVQWGDAQGPAPPRTFQPHQLIVTLLAELQLPAVLAQQLPVGAVHLLDGLADLEVGSSGSVTPPYRIIESQTPTYMT